jgi:hypothetical protein
MLLVPGYAGMLVCFWKAARRKAGAMHRPWDQGWPGHGVQQATTLEPPAGPSTCNTTRQCWRLECPTQWLSCIVAYWQSSSSVVEACSLKQPLISTLKTRTHGGCRLPSWSQTITPIARDSIHTTTHKAASAPVPCMTSSRIASHW